MKIFDAIAIEALQTPAMQMFVQNSLIFSALFTTMYNMNVPFKAYFFYVPLILVNVSLALMKVFSMNLLSKPVKKAIVIVSLLLNVLFSITIFAVSIKTPVQIFPAAVILLISIMMFVQSNTILVLGTKKK